MTLFLILLQGLTIGFLIAAPVGPIGILCIRRTLAGGRLLGFLTGMGAATADAFYGAVAGFGLTAISGFLLEFQTVISLIGGAFLIYLGIGSWKQRSELSKSESTDATALGKAYASTIFLTITNPSTILSFLAVFAGLGIGTMAASYGSAAALVTGVFLGSAFWWLMLSSFVVLFRQATLSKLALINKVSGVLLIGFGLWSIFQNFF